MIEVGQRAPAFTLPDADGETVRLSDLQGQWVILYFYPRDDTPGCTVEAREFSSLLEQFEDRGAVVLGCSPDTAERHCQFVEKHNLSVTLVSDPEHTVMEKYDAWGEKTLYGKKTVGVKRSTVLIDPVGKVAHHWRSVKTKGHAQKVLERFGELAGE